MGLTFGGQDMSSRMKRGAGRICGPLWQRITGVILTMALAASAGGIQTVWAATGYEPQPVLKASQS
jgi:hypothetical protein